MRALLFMGWLMFMGFSAIAQPGGSRNVKMPAIGHVYGKILDAKTGEPIPFVSVALFKRDSVVTGNLTKMNGEFSLEKIPYGKFMLKITSVGYKIYQQPVAVIPQNEIQDIGDLKLEPDEKVLKTVEVTEQKSTFEMNIDRKVFNVDKSITAKGGTATDVMRTIPSVTLDENGNAQLRQNSTTIYVDGRPTTLTLDQIPADQIEKVEVITNPSAKFEASTSGGIINIVMKGNTKPGYNGVVSGGIGTNERYNGMASLFWKQKPIGFSINYNYNTFRNPIEAYNYRTNLLNGAITGHADSDNSKVFKNTFNTGSAALDYYINNRNTLTLSENITAGYFNTQENQRYNVRNGKDSVLSSGNRLVSQVTNFQNYTTKLHYKKTFPVKGKELNADINFNLNNSKNENHYTTYSYDGNGVQIANSPVLQRNNGTGNSQMVTFQLDYTHPVNDSTKLEWGLRSNYKPLKQAIDASMYSYTSDSYIPDSLITTSRYEVTDLVNAAYISYSFRRNKTSFMLGLRFEDSHYNADRIVSGVKTPIGYNYPSNLEDVFTKTLFPSIFISRKLSERKEIQFNVTRKINRPNFRQLMPFISSSDARNITIGNPGLRPEMITLSEINYNALFNKGNLLLTVFYHNTQDPINHVTTIDPNLPDVVVTKSQNNKQSNTIGMDNTIKYTLWKGLEATLSLNLFYTSIDGGITTTNNEGFYYNSKLNIAYYLPKNFSLQLSGNYESPKIVAQGMNKEIYFIDAGISKELYKYITLAASVSDAFDTKGKGTDLTTDRYLQNYWSRRETRFVKVTLTVKFGKADATLFKRKSPSQRSEDSDSDF